MRWREEECGRRKERGKGKGGRVTKRKTKKEDTERGRNADSQQDIYLNVALVWLDKTTIEVYSGVRIYAKYETRNLRMHAGGTAAVCCIQFTTPLRYRTTHAKRHSTPCTRCTRHSRGIASIARIATQSCNAHPPKSTPATHDTQPVPLNIADVIGTTRVSQVPESACACPFTDTGDQPWMLLVPKQTV